MKGGTLFSGGGGFCLGMVAAGVEHAWGVEYDDRIAQVARDNGLNTITADILQCDPSAFEPVDFLHASPPCPNFSNAKANAEETDNDRALAAKVCEFITELLPSIFTLENVYAYRKSKSWQRIAKTLLTHGYQVNYWHVNMADYGVPQTRKRMIAIARRDGITPMLPPSTHAETAVNDLFGSKRQWVGWYEAIEDLIPTLPDSEFAPWQLERLPNELIDCLMVKDGDNYAPVVNGCIPSYTLSATNGSRAFIVNGTPNDNGASVTACAQDVPNFTITASVEKRPLRAFFVQAANSQSNGKITNEQCEPARTVDTQGTPKAFIAAQGKYGDSMPVYNESEPHGTVTANSNQTGIKGQVNGRVVKMTVHALARFQSFPDGYQWPDSNSLATRIIGNAVPPLFAQRLVEWLI